MYNVYGNINYKFISKPEKCTTNISDCQIIYQQNKNKIDNKNYRNPLRLLTQNISNACCHGM